MDQLIQTGAKNPADRPTMTERVQMVVQNWTRVKQYHQLNIDNSIENWRYYFAKNAAQGLGQYPKNVADMLLASSRQLHQYNIIMPTVDSLAGALLQMKFDPEFIPVNDLATSLTEAVEKAYHSDKEIMDWPGTWLDVVTGGMIHEGVCKMVISDKFDPLGNIGFETSLPGMTFSDPTWKSWKSSDCKKVWHEAWLDAAQLVVQYPEMKAELDFYLKQLKLNGMEYGPFSGVIPYQTGTGVWGSAFRIIEEYEVVSETRKVDYVLTPDGSVIIPADVPDMEKIAWLNQNVPDWQPDLVHEKPIKEEICYMRAAAPEISGLDLLQDKPTEVQIQATPWKFYSASRFNGEPHSVVDSIKDAQQNINSWESLITYKIQVEGGGGSQFADASKFQSDSVYNDYVANRNNPKKVFRLKPGVDPGTVTAPTVKSQFPQEAYSHLNHILQVMLPMISKVTPSSVGRSEANQQQMSGRLYEMMKIQSDAQAYTLHYGLRMFMNDIAESYLLQVPKTYSNEAQPRSFPLNGGKERITLNEPVDLPDGSQGIKNDASQLEVLRHKVIISEKPDSPATQMDNIDTFTKLITAFSSNPDKFVTINKLQGKIIENLPQLSQEDKEELEAINAKEIELEIVTLEARLINAQIALKTAQAQLQAIENPPPPPPPPPSNDPKILAEQAAAATGGKVSISFAAGGKPGEQGAPQSLPMPAAPPQAAQAQPIMPNAPQAQGAVT